MRVWRYIFWIESSDGQIERLGSRRSLRRQFIVLISAILHPHSLYNECDQCATAGLVHLTVGRVHLELAGFCKALEAFQRAHKIAHSIQDPSLELQVIRSLCSLVFLSA